MKQDLEMGDYVMSCIRARRRRPLLRGLIAHVLACYLCIGQVMLLNFIVRAIDPPTTIPGEEDDEDEPWFLQPWCFAAAAPITVPCALALMAVFTVFSPAERMPWQLTAVGWAMYLIPLILIGYGLYWRDKRNDPNLSGFPMTLKKPNGFD